MSFRTVRLEDVCEINPRAPKNISDEIPVSFIPMSAVSEQGFIAFEEARSYGEVKKGYTHFERGDVLVAKITPCFENGKATLTEKIKNKLGFGSTEFHVLRASPDLDPKYAFYLLWSERFRIIGEKGMTGSAGQKRVPADLLRRLEIPLPHIDEQKRIAAILDKADQLRQKRRQAIALLDSLTQSIFLEMFGDPVSNPKGWPKKAMSALTESRLGKMLDQKKMDGLSMYPYLANFNVQWNRIVLTELRQMGFSEAEKEEFILNDGDLLICEGGEIGRCAIWRNQLPGCYYQKALHRVKCDLRLCVPEYLLWFFSFMANNGGLNVHSSTATIAHLTGAKLKSLMVPTPPIELQNKFSKIYCFIETKTRVANLASDSAESLFSSLQHRAFSGQL